MIKKDSENTLKLRELSDDELLTVAGGDGDGSTPASPNDPTEGHDKTTGQRMHKPWAI